MKKIKIIEATIELGLGGTEYVIQLYSKYLNKDNFEVLVVGLNAGGERAQLIENLGIPVIVLDGDLQKLAQLLRETDVFHWHGNGTMKSDLAEVLKANKPKLVIQTNVFGLCDSSNFYNSIDYDLYVSEMILIRRMFLDTKLEDDFHSKRKALPNPVDTDYISNNRPSDEKVKQFKKDNNLQDAFIVGRIGRADDAKFDLITLDGFAKFINMVNNARFLLVGATPKILEYARKLNLLDRLIVIDNTSDFDQLLIYYRSIDVFLAASGLGESFGLVIAEAMAVGIPVITVSTPYKDNAQIELVDNSRTGLVVDRSSEKIASALYYLYKSPDTRAKFALASITKIARNYNANIIVKSLENLIYQHLHILLDNQEKSGLADFSQKMINNYNDRVLDLWQQ